MLAVHGTYDTARASWYEAMGIMPVVATRRPVGGADPFRTNVDRARRADPRPPARERPPRRRPGGLREPAALADGPRTTQVQVRASTTARATSALPDAARAAGRRPASPCSSSTGDAGHDVCHTITACRAPCNAPTGIAFPLANGAGRFDSGQLGFGPALLTAAANRDTWSTPATLTPGTYAYFCRVHPFMRGAFRVKG